jgi:hypothetical protein
MLELSNPAYLVRLFDDADSRFRFDGVGTVVCSTMFTCKLLDTNLHLLPKSTCR